MKIPTTAESTRTMIDKIKNVVDGICNLPDDEFLALMNEFEDQQEKDKCQLNTCQGQCQGMGWCDDAKSFREENHMTLKTFSTSS